MSIILIKCRGGGVSSSFQNASAFHPPEARAGPAPWIDARTHVMVDGGAIKDLRVARRLARNRCLQWSSVGGKATKTLPENRRDNRARLVTAAARCSFRSGKSYDHIGTWLACVVRRGEAYVRPVHNIILYRYSGTYAE